MCEKLMYKFEFINSDKISSFDKFSLIIILLELNLKIFKVFHSCQDSLFIIYRSSYNSNFKFNLIFF